MTFVKNMHPSHDWHGIEPNWAGQMCHACLICTCHDSGYATRPCGDVLRDHDAATSASKETP